MSKDVRQIEKRWEVRPKVSEDIWEQLLHNRGIKKEEEELFLNPRYERDLTDPFLMQGMKEAVERIERAVKDKEKIGIFGDYDADGVPGAALLKEVMEILGLKTEVYIPDRDEGYGLNEQGIRYFVSKKVGLIITVDNGIAGREQVELAKSLGLDTIVADHHEYQEDLYPSQAVAVLDPKQPRCKYPFKELAGTGVAFKLAQALAIKTGKISESQLKWLLDLVAISTFCDMVPLVGENRVLAKFGLMVLSKTRRLGLRELYQTAGINPEAINPYVVGFMIGPRLNAPGRMGKMSAAFRLLTAGDKETALSLAKELEEANKERQAMLDKILYEANEKVQIKKLHKNKVIMVDGEGWPDGIIGLVAGRLTERYGRPSIVIGRQEVESKGSARSVEGFHLVEALNECQEYLVKHGGHAKAAGLTVASEHLEMLYDRILEVAESRLQEGDLVPKINCEAELELSNINWSFYEKLTKLEPYGLGNPRPVFLSRNVIASRIGVVGNGGKHLKCVVGDKKAGVSLAAIGFGLGEGRDICQEGEIIDIVYTIDEDAWRGGNSLQLKLIDWRKAEGFGKGE